ncbi:MAG: oligoendopeptidase F [Chloroflexota bacterium]
MATGIKRKDAAPGSTWQPEKIFASWAEWEADYETAIADLLLLGEFKGKLTESPEKLDQWIKTFTSQTRRIARLMIFAQLSTSVDGADPEPKKYIGQMMALQGKLYSSIAFAEPELLENKEIILKWIESNPALQVYQQYFDNLIRQAAHLRNAEVEEILGLLSDPFGQTSRTASELSNVDIKFADAIDSQGKTHPVRQSLLIVNASEPDRQLRRTAWESFCDGYAGSINTFASNYIAHVKQQVFMVRVRGYESVLDAALSPYKVPTSVFHNLIDTFRANLPTWHKYWEVKRKALGVEKIYPFDIWAPIGKVQPVVKFSQAVDYISKGVAPLGEEYVSALRKGCLEEGWVDWFPNDTKRQGAFSMPSHDTPPYIMMSYSDTVKSMSTLAHELGHSMHSYLIEKNQIELYNGYGNISMTSAETASNFNQAMVRSYLTKELADDKDFQLALLEEAMTNYHRYMFQMLNLATFEFEVYSRAEQGKPLSTQILLDLMGEIYAAGYGKTMTDDSARTATTWAQFGHLYVPFYTFQYSVGISAADYLSQNILTGDTQAAENYLNFLKSGGSRYTMDLFNLAGVEMDSPRPVEKAFAVLAEMIDQIEKITA